MESSCIPGILQYQTIVYYSHLIPISISLVVVFFVLLKSGYSLLSKIFSLFTISFCLWLAGDIFAWLNPHYDLISFVWAPLDYINILFYLFAAYFFFVLIKGRDVSIWYKLSIFALSLPAWFITFTNQSITGFDTTWCEAFNNEFLTQYKLAIEVLVVLFIIVVAIYELFKKQDRKKKRQVAIVSTALLLFLLTFSVTEYISSQTGIYEINLYSLFVLPVFLFMIIFSITNLRIFNIRLAGTQLLVYIMIILVGSQFFFLENATNQVLTTASFILALSFGVVLVKDAKREVEQREHIEKLAGELKKANVRLTELDKQKSEFVSFATHQLRAPLTAMKGYASLILEDELGSLSKEVREAISRIYDSSKTLASIVDDYLNISRIELGTMKYSFETLDLKDLVEHVVGELKPNIERSGLAFGLSTKPADPKERFMIHADKDKLKQVIANLIDNSVKYTPKGSLEVSISKNAPERKIIFSVKDTGVGIAPEVMPKLFAKFVRADNANKQNIYGTGLGLFVAKEIVSSHHGRIWAESEGEGKGSTFFLEMEMAV